MIRYTVVVADDEPHVVESLSLLLESVGHIVVGKAKTGEEAIWLTQTLSPDVVILDLGMPGVDGLEAARRIMKTHPAPIVVCTAHCNDELINAVTSAGAFAYVVKPCRLNDLLPAINIAVSRFEDSKILKGEVDHLKQTLEDRKCIEKAKGIVMRMHQISEDEAHRFLQAESQRKSKSLPELAKAIVLADNALSVPNKP